MDFTLKSLDPVTTQTDCLIVPIYENDSDSTSVKAINKACAGALKLVSESGDFTGKAEETLMLHQNPGIKAKRVLLMGVGPKADLTAIGFKKSVSAAMAIVKHTDSKDVTVSLADIKIKGQDDSKTLQQAVEQISASTYSFDEYKSKPEKPKLKKVCFSHPGAADAEPRKKLTQGLAEGIAIAEGVTLARNLGNTPPNVCHPSYLAAQAQQLGKKYSKLSIKIIDEKELEKMGAGAFVSVSKGSKQPGKLIIMQYKGGKADNAPHAIVGKGITFDTGGISLKPGPSMDEMKYDMCGAASVFGTMKAICEMNPKINVVGVVAAAENMPDGKASRPGDIVTTLSGQTVEILNTDAEGRLVLCDALTYVGRFKPASVIDIATLTGACIVALGNHASAMLANDDQIAANILDAGLKSQDRAWQLPLWDEYQKQLDSPFADMANIGGPPAGTITAACFLSRYTKDYKWAHLDIAGTSFVSGGMKRDATGRPVSLLTRYLLDRAAEPPQSTSERKKSSKKKSAKNKKKAKKSSKK